MVALAELYFCDFLLQIGGDSMDLDTNQPPANPTNDCVTHTVSGAIFNARRFAFGGVAAAETRRMVARRETNSLAGFGFPLHWLAGRC